MTSGMLSTPILKLSCLVAASLLVACSLALAADPDAEIIARLTDRNFEQTRDQSDAMLVDFYLPDCSRCRLFEAEFRKAAMMARSAGLKVVFASVDAADFEAMTAYFRVNSFPTVRLFYNSSSILYEGPQDSSSIFVWMQAKLDFHPQVVTVDEYESVRDSEEIGLAFMGPQGLEFEQFKRFGRTLEDVRILHVDYKKPGNRINTAIWHPDKPFSIVMFKNRGQTMVVYDLLDLSIDQLMHFFESRRYPLVSTLDSDCSMRRIFHQPGLSILLLVDDAKDAFRAKFGQVAKSYSPTVKFFVVRKTDKYAQEIRDYFSLDAGYLRQVRAVLQSSAGIDSFRLSDTASARSLHRFVQRINSGRIPLAKGTASSNDEGIIIDLSTAAGRQAISKLKSTLVIFNFKGRQCRRRRSCLSKMARFKRIALQLHRIVGLEFCELDFDHLHVSTANMIRLFRTALPAVSISGGRLNTSTAVIEDFDWRYRSMVRHLARIAGMTSIDFAVN